jgi:hypothetical protein
MENKFDQSIVSADIRKDITRLIELQVESILELLGDVQHESLSLDEEKECGILGDSIDTDIIDDIDKSMDLCEKCLRDCKIYFSAIERYKKVIIRMKEDTITKDLPEDYNIDIYFKVYEDTLSKELYKISTQVKDIYRRFKDS